MCNPINKGGLRCHAHAKSHLAKMTALVSRSDATPEVFQRHELAQLQYDATATGLKRIRADITAKRRAKEPFAPVIDRLREVQTFIYERRVASNLTPDEADLIYELKLDEASNSSTAATLTRFAKDPDHAVRTRVLFNPNIPDEALIIFAQSNDWKFRQAAAAHPLVTASMLSRLSKDPNSIVRSKVASNPLSSPTVLTKLAEDRDGVVVRSVFDNPNTPDDAREVAREKVAHLRV